MKSQPTYYDLLKLTSDATQDEIRRAYHEAARQLHPDVSNDPGSTELFIQVQKAYEVLSDPKARAGYDKNLPKPSTTEEEISDNEVQVVGEAVKIKITYSRTNLPKLEESQLFYVLLDITVPKDLNARPSPPLNACLVIDRSTSMRGLRMDAVKATALELLHHLRPEDTFSIVTFSDRAEVVLPANRGYRRHEVGTKISKIQSSGGTELYHGLEAGFYEVRRYLNSMQVNHVILLTDGRTYGDEEECIQLAEKMASAGISLSALGIGEEWNDLFLDRLVNKTGGSSCYVADHGAIAEFMENKFRGLSRVYAEQLALKVKNSSGVLLQYALRLQPDAIPLPVGSPIRIGGIPNDNGARVLLEFVIAPGAVRSQRFTLADCELSMDVPSLNQPNYKVTFRLQRSIGQVFKPEIPPNPIVQSVSQMSLLRMQDRISQELMEGNLVDANEIMRHLATQLLARGEQELASTVLREADRIQKKQQISEQGKKQIKYGTRALMLPVDLLEERA